MSKLLSLLGIKLCQIAPLQMTYYRDFKSAVCTAGDYCDRCKYSSRNEPITKCQKYMKIKIDGQDS